MFEELEDSGTPRDRDVKIVDELEEQEAAYSKVDPGDAMEVSNVVIQDAQECCTSYSNEEGDVTWVGEVFIEDIKKSAERDFKGDVNKAFGKRLDYIGSCVSRGIRGLDRDCTVKFEISYDDNLTANSTVKILCIFNEN